MAKGRGQRHQSSAVAKSAHGLKPRSTPLKHAKAASPHAPKSSKHASGKPIPLPSAEKHVNTNGRKQAPVQDLAPSEEQLRRRAEQRINLAPSDEEGSELSEGSSSDEEQQQQLRIPNASKDEDREAYERALRRMEMG